MFNNLLNVLYLDMHQIINPLPLENWPWVFASFPEYLFTNASL